jgi:hypothetical protein
MQVKQTGEIACKGKYPGHYSALKAEEVEVRERGCRYSTERGY